MGRYKITPTIIRYDETRKHDDIVIAIDPLTHTYWFGVLDYDDFKGMRRHSTMGWNNIELSGKDQYEEDIDLNLVDMLCEANNRDVTREYSLGEYICFVKLKHALFREKNNKKGTK